MSRYDDVTTKFDVAESRQVLSFRTAIPLNPAACFAVRLGADETFESLAYKYYGSSRLWWVIADQNPLIHPLFMTPGNQVLILKTQNLEAARLPARFGL